MFYYIVLEWGQSMGLSPEEILANFIMCVYGDDSMGGMTEKLAV